MKNNFYNIFILSILLFSSIKTIGQTTDCNFFCVTNIQLDTSNANSLLVTIWSMDSAANHINYPYLRAVINSNGDTVASNTNLQFFAHIGGTTMDYSIPTTLDSVPTNFTGMVILNYNDLTGGNGDTSCVLTYPCVVNNTQKLLSEFVSIQLFPNPATQQTTLFIDSPLLDDYNLNLYDTQGRMVLQKNNLNASFVEINLQDLVRGLYFVRLTNSKNQLIGTSKLRVN